MGAIAAGSTAWFLTMPAVAAVQSVATGNFYYEDETVGDGKIVINVGDQLRFVVQDGGPGTPHTVEIDFFDVHSGGIASGETYTTKALNTAGTYRLYCKPHQKRGHVTSLVIQGESAPAPAPTTARPAPTSAAPTPTTAGPRPASSTPPSTSTAQPRTTPTMGTPGGTPRATTPPPGEAAAGSAVAEGRGVASADELDPGSLGTSDLEETLGRPLARPAPWTRGVRIALLFLAPMAVLAAVAFSRWREDAVTPPE